MKDVTDARLDALRYSAVLERNLDEIQRTMVNRLLAECETQLHSSIHEARAARRHFVNGRRCWFVEGS